MKNIYKYMINIFYHINNENSIVLDKIIIEFYAKKAMSGKREGEMHG